MAGAFIKEMRVVGTFSGKMRLSAFIWVIRLPGIYFSVDVMVVVFLPAYVSLFFAASAIVQPSEVPGAGVVAEFRHPSPLAVRNVASRGRPPVDRGCAAAVSPNR